MRKPKEGSRLAELIATAHTRGFIVSTWSPGDGLTRYRFFPESSPAGQDYWGPNSAVYTALGIKEAFTFICGVGVGQRMSK